MTNYSVGENTRCVEVFLDTKRLKRGKQFNRLFAKAHVNSAVVLPIVSCDALKNMTDHDVNRCDNVLLEWMC